MPTQSSEMQTTAPTTVRLGGKKSDQAYEALKKAIVLRQYQPGTQMREQSIANEFQCSQSTVREAFMNLVKDGLVRRTGYHGTHVTDTSLEEAVLFVRVRLTIERDVATKLHALKDSFDLRSVEDICSAMDVAHSAGDLFQNSELDRRFHVHLAELAGMELMSPVLYRCALHIHRFTHSSLEVPRDFLQETGSGDEHRQLFSDMTTGTEKQARSAISQHLASVLQRWSPSLYAAVGPSQFK